MEENKKIRESESIAIPDELPVLPVRSMVIYPYMVSPVLVGKPGLIRLVDDVLDKDRMLALVTPKNQELENLKPENLYSIGCVGMILRMMRTPTGGVQIWVQGMSRIRTLEYSQTEPYLKAKVEPVKEEYEMTLELQALMRNLVELFSKAVSMTTGRGVPDELALLLENVDDPSKLADIIAANLPLPVPEKQELLESIDLKTRLSKLSSFLNRELEILELQSKIQSQTKTDMDKIQKEFYLRNQLEAIRKELGEVDEKTAELNELKDRLEAANLPSEVKKEAERELNRLAKMPPAAAEYVVSRTYLDWIMALPWNKSTEDRLDLKTAQKVLDEDHYDLDKVKERILEYLAVRKLKSDMKGPILCFAGPPGVGKTSLGRSIAKAMGRKFVRLSLGGIRDEAEIRGHRRTYIGALPGRIIQSIKQAESNNPVFMLDEIDKLGADFRGDPAAALLEVLDPEQNNTFSDHYLDVPFDLSKVMFITTANIFDTIPRALLDRMEVLNLPGYTDQEKLQIAKTHLIPKQLSNHGISSEQLEFTEDSILEIIRAYTREAGLRNLEREIANVCRKVAKAVALNQGSEDQGSGIRGQGSVKDLKDLSDTQHPTPDTQKVIIKPEDLSSYLGAAKFFSEVAERTDEPGVAVALAWTEAGGDVLFIEATKMPGQSGKKTFTLTGQLGDVMQESARAALSYIRSRADVLGIDSKFFDKYDLHLHIPSGAIPKDGPSAGITMATALASLIIGNPVKSDLAMTGEITLRGKVLPVGGIKEKVLAASRANIKEVIIPKRNQKDLQEIPKEIREQTKFHLVDRMDEVLEVALPKRQGKNKSA